MKKGSTFYKLVDDAANRFGDREFLYDTYTRMSFEELRQHGLAVARWLSAAGIRPGDTVVTCVPNWNEFVALYAGVSACGAILAPCSPVIGTIRLCETVGLLDPVAVVVTRTDQVDTVLEADYQGLLVDIRLDDGRCQHYEDISLPGSPEAAADANGFEPVWSTEISTILFTSGSTGAPKGVLSTAYAHEYVASQIAACMKATAEDVVFTPIAFFHIFGLCNGLLIALMNGARLVHYDRYTVEGALDLIVQEGCTVHLGVPTMFIRELKQSNGRLEGARLRTGIIGGSPPPLGLIEEFEKRCRCRLLPSFGMTETTGGVTYTKLDAPAEKRYVANGEAIPGAEMTVVDEEGNLLDRGEQGQLIVKTPGMMAGYYHGGPVVPDEDVMNGWLATGDLGFVDEDGYLHVTGRIKDVIIRGGVNVYPNEIESVYYYRPDILDASLVGYPDDELGERTCLFVVLNPEATQVSPDELRAYAKGRIEREKIPDRIVILDAMPRLGASKYDKGALKSMLVDGSLD